MKKALQTNGNTWHIYLSKPIIQLLGITANNRTVLLNIENKVLFVKKISNDEIEKYKDFLCKNLIKRGSSYGLNIPIPILNLLDVNPEKDLIDYEINGQILKIKKAD